MRSISYRCITSLWSSHNTKIIVESRLVNNYFIKRFFKSWMIDGLPEGADVKVFFEQKNESDVIDNGIFSYQRYFDDEGVLCTNIIKIRHYRALLRSIYKCFFKKKKVIGFPELYMAIIRTSIFEPLEFLAARSGWRIFHGAAFTLRRKTILLSAGSKQGKSTIIEAIRKIETIDILSDNYCLFNGLMVRSIEEPMRGGQPSFLEQSYYGRRIFGSPDLFESELHCLVILVMSDRNQLSEITAQEAILSLDIINKKEKEGVDFLDVADGLLNLNAKYSINMDRSIKCYRLEVAYGLENVKFAVKNLTGDF